MGKRKADSGDDSDGHTSKKIGLTALDSRQPLQASTNTPLSALRVPTLPSLTPWTVADIVNHLPPLPPILDPTLETATFTHSGVAKPGAMSYERLEWLGDAYLELISSILISSTFTSHPPGKCAAIREMLVKNETLAQYAIGYGFEPKLNVPQEFLNGTDPKYHMKGWNKTKVLGDVFEAYVAAVIQSDLQNGVQKAMVWLKSLWTTTIGTWIAEEEARKQRDRKKSSTTTDRPEVSANDRVQQQIGYQGRRIQYKDEELREKNEQGLPMYRITCYLGDSAGMEPLRKLGEAVSKNKKEARLMAAQNVLDDEGLMKELTEKKAEYIKTVQAKGLANSRWAR